MCRGARNKEIKPRHRQLKYAAISNDPQVYSCSERRRRNTVEPRPFPRRDAFRKKVALSDKGGESSTIRPTFLPEAGATIKAYERSCYDAVMFNFGKPKNWSDWVGHIAGVIVAVLLVWWMLRLPYS